MLFAFLRFTRLPAGRSAGHARRDREAAQQMGVDVDTVDRTVFAVASALGGLSGLLVGMYYNNISPAMSFQATLKGVVAVVIGGVGNVPGAIFGSVFLGLIESYGIALFGTSYRNLFAYVILILVLIFWPNGLFGGRAVPPEPLTGTFIAPSRPVPPAAPGSVWAFTDRCGLGAAALSPVTSPYVHPDPQQRLALWHAGAEPDPGRGHRRANRIGTRGVAFDRRLCLGAAGARSRRTDLFALDPGRAGVVTSASSARLLVYPAIRPARPLYRHRDTRRSAKLSAS